MQSVARKVVIYLCAFVRSLWPLSKEETSKIILSFFLLCLVGTYLNHQFQTQSWERQVQYDILKDDFEEKRQVLLDLTQLVNERLFATQKVLWSLEDGNEVRISGSWERYLGVVEKWNQNISLMQQRLVRSFGYEVASELLTYDDDLNNMVPGSIHYKFYKVHQELAAMRECYYNGCLIPHDSTKVESLIDHLIAQETLLLSRLNYGVNEYYGKLQSSPVELIKNQNLPYVD